METESEEDRLRPPSERRILVLEIEEGERIKKVKVKEREVCWEGFREVRGKLLRGVPKMNPKDCLKYCRHEGCDFL
ncbi:MAG: hypothetical protein JSW53_05015 [Candidatus Bathyarchaeota archaeon]|nr:MAG: hypothetical protein JSW53_05015 [Candidatus Bathyarchaeota archaeon]